MERKKIDLRDKIKEEDVRIEIDYRLEDLFAVGDSYRLPEDYSVSLESLLFCSYSHLRFSDLYDSMWIRISDQAKKEQKENRLFPEAMKTIKELDDLKEKCLQLEEEFSKRRENYHEKFELLKKEEWYQEYKTADEILVEKISKYNKLLYEAFKSNTKDRIYKFHILENEILKEIDSIKNEHPEIPELVWNETVKEREYPLKEGSRYIMNEYSSHSLAIDIIKNKLSNNFPVILSEYRKYTRLLDETKCWIDELYTKSFDLEKNEEIYRIVKDNRNNQWYENFDGEIIKQLSQEELKKTVIEVDIPLIENSRDTFVGYSFLEDAPCPLAYGWYLWEEDTNLHSELIIMQVGINFIYSSRKEGKSFDIWWLWPNNYSDRINLLKRINEIIQKSGLYTFHSYWQQEFEKNLLRVGLIDKLKSGSMIEEQKLSEQELKEIEQIFFTSKTFQKPYLFDYFYFKRSSNPNIDLDQRYYNVLGIDVELIKYSDEENETDYLLFLLDNETIENINSHLFYRVNDFHDILTMIKILNQVMKNNGFFRIDEILTKESLDLLCQQDRVNEKVMFEGINEFFLQFETFNFNSDVALEEISKKPITKGINWKQYVKEYRISLTGKTQKEIASEYGVTQQAISGHKNIIKKELSRMIGESHRIWLEEKYKAELNVLEVERNGRKGKADLIIYKKGGLIEVINAKAAIFNLNSSAFTILGKEYQPEIEEARELEKEGKKVIVYIDFFNLYNKERYPRIPIDHNKPPERVTMQFDDYVE